ncbi:MAG: NAD(P)-dependent oxidoreductase [Rubrivivax sp.]|nr:MAG: NAD(P)-dependent oxidoreductase [Rubrivivax sp.]
MRVIVIFGGSGFIGSFLAERWLETGLADQVVIADIKPSALVNHPGIVYRQLDVREPIPTDLCATTPEWIFNFAAIHREPGHEHHEYFDTNLKGAETVTQYAEAVACKNIFFTSSISVYGPTPGPTTENARMCPISPYGGSKFPAELIHRGWQSRGAERRLMIIRPGVVYGPRDPGNIGRMIKAIQKGYFAFPGSMNIHKSYAYIYGLLDSIEFVINSGESVVTYNYVETPTETLGDIASQVREFVGSKAPIMSLPTSVLLPAAHLVQTVAGSLNPVHPVRVKKAGMPTHIVPKKLQDMGFPFKYTFKSSLEHWAKLVPSDFGKKAA